MAIADNLRGLVKLEAGNEGISQVTTVFEMRERFVWQEHFLSFGSWGLETV